MEIYRMEALGTIPLGASAAVMAFLYGYGKTKLTLLLNFSRVFVFRIPVLWGLQHFTDLGNVSAGIVMAVSNIMTAVMSLRLSSARSKKKKGQTQSKANVLRQENGGKHDWYTGAEENQNPETPGSVQNK